MTVSRGLATIALAGGLAAGCTSSGSDKHSTGPTTQPSGSGSVTQCTDVSATNAKQTLITSAGFTPSCVKIKAKAKFFFVNNEKKHHPATTEPGAPQSFDADLQKKGSTYQQAFKKKGVYVIVDKITKKSMTLYVDG